MTRTDFSWRTSLLLLPLGLIVLLATGVVGRIGFGGGTPLAGRLEALLDAANVDRSGLPPVAVDRDVLIHADGDFEVWHRVFDEEAASEFVAGRDAPLVTATVFVFTARGGHVATYAEQTSAAPDGATVHRLEDGSHLLVLHPVYADVFRIDDPPRAPGDLRLSGEARVVHLTTDGEAREVYRVILEAGGQGTRCWSRLVTLRSIYLQTSLVRVTDCWDWQLDDQGRPVRPVLVDATMMVEAVWDPTAADGKGAFLRPNKRP